eukprot:5299803-Amphidinium_carterae.1
MYSTSIKVCSGVGYKERSLGNHYRNGGCFGFRQDVSKSVTWKTRPKGATMAVVAPLAEAMVQEAEDQSMKNGIRLQRDVLTFSLSGESWYTHQPLEGHPKGTQCHG